MFRKFVASLMLAIVLCMGAATPSFAYGAPDASQTQVLPDTGSKGVTVLLLGLGAAFAVAGGVIYAINRKA